MKHFNNSRVLQITGLFLGALVWLANNANPPNGYSGAPFESTCNTGTCHGNANSNGYDASVSLDGLPSTIQAGIVYPLTLTVTITAGTPIKAGFQAVAVAADNSNAGTFAAVNAQTGTESYGGRTYIDHRGGKVFSGGSVTWNFNWTAPVTANGNAITFYYIANLTNNNTQQTGDHAVAFNTTYAFNGPPPVAASISNTTNVACFGGNTGSATVDPSGGAPPYTYHWSNNQTTQTAINLVAGTYSVTVTGSSGTGTATTFTVITQPPVINLSASASGVITCVNQNATGMANATGGTPPFSYLWSNGQSGNTTTFTSSGAYTVVVTDNNGCTKIATVNVAGNTTPPNAVASAPNNLSCSQTSVTLSGTGSSTGANYTYFWSGPGIVSGASTLNPVVNMAGTYILTVTNTTNGCTATASATVTSSATPPGATASGGTITCSAPSVTLNAMSGTSGVSYAWSGPSFSSNLQNPVVNTAGTYTVTVTNPANSCTSTATATVNANTAVPQLTASAGAAITCTTISSQVFASSTTSGVTYAWAGPNTFSSTQQNPTVPASGTYTVTVTAPNGCISTGTATVTQNTTAPGASATGGTLTCTTTSVTLMGTSGGAQPSYSWNGPGGASAQQNFPVTVPGTYTLTVTSAANGCTSTSSAVVATNTTPPVAAAATPNNLNCNNATVQINGSASSQGANFTYLWSTANGNIVSGATTVTPVVSAMGLYTLVVTNTDNGCTASASVTVNLTPAVTAATGSVSNVSCNGNTNGSVTAIPGGGNGTYSYAWSSGPTTATISNLAAGVYIVTISDGETCTATASATITQPAVLAANATATGETASGANNGSATAAPTGGTAPFLYLWNTNATTPTISSLAPGAYTVVVTDANACSATQTVTVNSFNCTLSASISATNASCNGASNGTATVSLTGAANPVTYAWSNGATTPSVSGLAPGTYTVQILDGNACPAILNATISEPTALASNATATGETAAGANDGTATAQPAGGTSPYSYHWNTNASTPSIANLSPGSYTVTVTDANSCTVVQSVTVNPFNCAVTASANFVNVSCTGGNNGQATVVLSGGTLPISYAWSNGANTATAANLGAGTYTATATDGSGCAASQTVVISEPTPLLIALDGVTNVVCPEDHSGTANIVASGGTPPYTYSWPGGGATGFGVGTYTVTVVDGNGCSALQSFSIISTDNIAPSLACPGNIVICGVDQVDYPGPVASDNCSLAGNQPVLTGGQPSGSAFDEGVSTQTFQVTDASGNTGTCSFTVTVNPVPDVMIDAMEDETGGSSNGSIKITSSGGTGPYIFSWNKNGAFFSNDEDLTGISAGVYTLVVIDAKGCTVALSPITIGNIVGTIEPGTAVSIHLLPNPAYTAFRVDMNGVQALVAQIMDPRGQLIQEIEPADLLTTVQVDQLPTGLYYLRILTEEGRWVVLKWVKAE